MNESRTAQNVSNDPQRACTILLATYNRPDLMRRQLDYLCSSPRLGPIDILDSSSGFAADENEAAAIGRAGVHYLRLPPETPVFAKFSLGMDRVKTPYAMLVPDDDFVWVEVVPCLVDALESDRSACVAHGLNLEFTMQGKTLHAIGLIGGANSHRGGTASDRVLSLMRRYEAITYALYRAEPARRAFAAAKDQDSVLAQELLAANLTAAQGGLLRIPVVTHGRRAGSTLGYRRWHPLEWSAVDPHGMFEAYGRYRSVLLSQMMRDEPGADEPWLARKLDLAHLTYLVPYLRPEVLEAVAKYPCRRSDEEMAERAWDAWAGAASPLLFRRLRSGSRLTRWMRRKVRASGVRYRFHAWMQTVRHPKSPLLPTSIRFHPSLKQAIERLGLDVPFSAYEAPLGAALERFAGTVREGPASTGSDDR